MGVGPLGIYRVGCDREEEISSRFVALPQQALSNPKEHERIGPLACLPTCQIASYLIPHTTRVSETKPRCRYAEVDHVTAIR